MSVLARPILAHVFERASQPTDKAGGEASGAQHVQERLALDLPVASRTGCLTVYSSQPGYCTNCYGKGLRKGD